MQRNSFVLFTTGLILFANSTAGAGPLTALTQMRQTFGDSNAQGGSDSTQHIDQNDALDFSRYLFSLPTFTEAPGAMSATTSWQDSIIGPCALLASGGFHSEIEVQKGATFAYGQASSHYNITFEIEDASSYEIIGIMTADDSSQSRLSLSRGTFVLHDIILVNGAQPVAFSGTLEPGIYRFFVQAAGTAFSMGAGADVQNAHFDVQLRMCGPQEDITGDGVVDVFDLFMLLDGWGSCGEFDSHCLADIDNDHVVNIFDLFELLGAWGQ